MAITGVPQARASITDIPNGSSHSIGKSSALASDEIRFRPGAYHNGSVWLWDTHHIAKGLRRLGYKDEAADLDSRLLDVLNVTNIFPEYVRGEQNTIALNTSTVVLWDSIQNRENVVEQPPQEVQAWTVAAISATQNRVARNQAAQL